MVSEPDPGAINRSRFGQLTIMVLLAMLLTVIVMTPRVSSTPGAVIEKVPVVGDSTAVVGDSITVVARPDITSALGRNDHLDVRAKWGQRIDQMMPALSEALARHPSAVVVNLGTNDALQARTHPDWQRAFDQMIAMLTPTRCVLLTTVSTLVPSLAPSPQVASAINAALARVVAEHPNFHVVDWNAALHAAGGTHLLSWDRIHPSPAGRTTLARLIRAGLEDDCTRTPA